MKNKISKVISLLLVALFVLSTSITAFANTQTPSTYSQVIYVSTNGNDTTGDGSSLKPYASVDVAVNKAVPGSLIYIKAGTYHLKQMIGGDSFTNVGILDYGKEITVCGENEKTILEYYGSESTGRDGSPFGLSNSKSIVKNLTMNYYPGKTENYSNAIFRWCYGSFYNVYVHVKGSVKASYSYCNDSSGLPNVNNCTFYHDLGAIAGNFTSTPVYTNCLFNVAPIQGTQKYCITYSFDSNNFLDTSTNSNILHKGTGVNPDGSVANIGVYGGTFAWGYNTPQPTTQKLKLVLELSEEKQLSVSNDLIDNTDMTWTSSDTSIATVDENGRLKAVKPGDTVVTSTSKDGSYTESINVLIVDLAKQLAVDLKIGDTCRLTVDDMANTANVTWTAYDAKIATVSSKGKVTAVSEGLTYITATDNNGKEIGRIYIRVRE